MLTNGTMAGFTAPVEIPTDPWSFLWMLPLIAGIALVYKALKLPKISAMNLIKETFVLICTISVFLFGVAVVLYVVARLITE